MEDTEEQLEDEDSVEAEEEADAEAQEAEAPAEPATPAPPRDAADGDVEPIDLLVKKEAKAGEDEDDDALLSLAREERLEPLAVKVVPPQSTEFVCKKCYLVKHRSQLKDKNRMLCRDCA